MNYGLDGKRLTWIQPVRHKVSKSCEAMLGGKSYHATRQNYCLDFFREVVESSAEA